MKKILVAIFMITFFATNAQENTKAEDIFTLKAGLIGGWISYEKALGDVFTLNSEVGYEGGFLRGTTNNKLDYVFTSTLSLEPRYYYNFNMRQNKGKSIKNNTANYISAELFYVPDVFSSTNRKNLQVQKSFGIIPKYGLRRNLSENLVFELAIGFGYLWGENNAKGRTAALDLRLCLNL